MLASACFNYYEDECFDAVHITRADGVGPKLAQRVVNELADKVGHLTLGKAALGTNVSGAAVPANPALADAVSALVNLGYGRAEAHAAVVLVMQGLTDPGVEDLLPLALKELGR